VQGRGMGPLAMLFSVIENAIESAADRSALTLIALDQCRLDGSSWAIAWPMSLSPELPPQMFQAAPSTRVWTEATPISRLAPEGLAAVTIQCISEAATLRSSVETLTASSGRRGGPSVHSPAAEAAGSTETRAERRKRLATAGGKDKEKEKELAPAKGGATK